MTKRWSCGTCYPALAFSPGPGFCILGTAVTFDIEVRDRVQAIYERCVLHDERVGTRILLTLSDLSAALLYHIRARTDHALVAT